MTSDWELDLAGRVGRAVAGRRTALLLTADALSERTRKLGYAIPGATIGKIEANARSGKLEVAELLVLAAALETPPVLLLVPQCPDGSEEVLPGLIAGSDAAARWISGTDGLPIDGDADRGLYATSDVYDGIALVESANATRERELDEFRRQIDSDPGEQGGTGR